MPRRQSQAWLNSGISLRKPGDWICSCGTRNFKWRGNCCKCGAQGEKSATPVMTGWDLALRGWRNNRANQANKSGSNVSSSEGEQTPRVPPQVVEAAPSPRIIQAPKEATNISNWISQQMADAYLSDSDSESEYDDSEPVRGHPAKAPSPASFIPSVPSSSFGEPTPGPQTPSEGAGSFDHEEEDPTEVLKLVERLKQLQQEDDFFYASDEE
eukprot:TRINITY_DN4307_c0_g4_i1.p1 TRINITY_DN4307_c0_g4~~TRINITY_DN4307_c0_g4_i1.p1  ORF type:complete len:233 (+),score=65.65 TRINITY_DN4307_c0_g4_i1:64-699(+)